MTGLETAVILIAFVTVAAVFGYAVLSAGLFSAERGKETIYAGLQQAKANMEITGSVIAYGDNATNPPTKVARVLFTCRNAIAGAPIDMTPNQGGRENRCIISLTTTTAYYNNVKWTAQFVGNHDADQLLEAGEQLEITLDMADLGAGFGDPGIGPNAVFNIQVKPTQGSTMTIQRTLPAAIDPVMDLDLLTGSGSTSAGGGGGGGGAVTQPAISVSPITLGFGIVSINVTSTELVVTVSNTGTANLTVGEITLTGTNADQFSIISDTASFQTIGPGDAWEVTVTFVPDSTGAKSATLSIPSNDPVHNPVTVALSGTGTGTPSLICTNMEGFVDSGHQVVELYITFQNNGTAPAHISPSAVTLAVDGGAAAVITWEVNSGSTNPFWVGQTCLIFTTTTLTLQAGQTFTITVTPDGGSALSIIRTIPGGLSWGYHVLPP